MKIEMEKAAKAKAELLAKNDELSVLVSSCLRFVGMNYKPYFLSH